MNKEKLEQMFDEYFWKYADRWKTIPAFDEQNVKSFIFETIIPEVLNSVVWKECIKYNLDISWNMIKNSAKELYWITL
jgi:hypothetical protein